MARKKLLNIRSSAVNTTGGTTSPKLPTSEQIEYGEIAVNFAKGYETMAIRNNNDEIITFSNDKYWENIVTENEQIVAAALNKLNSDIDELSGEVDTHISDADIHVTAEDKERWDEGSQDIEPLSGKVDNIIESVDLNSDGTYKPLSGDRLLSGASSVASALSIVSEIIVENEEIVASSLSDLDSRVIEVTDDLSAHTSNTTVHVTSSEKSAWNAKQDELTAGTGIDITDNVISCTASAVVDPDLDPDAQNAVAISAITKAIFDDEKAIASALSDLDSRVIGVNDDLSAHTEDTSVHVTSAEKTVWNGKQDELSAGTGIDITDNVISCTASAVVDPDLDPDSPNAVANSAITIAIEENEEIVASALVDLDARVIEVTDDLSAHTEDSSVHVTSSERSAWNAKQDELSASTGIAISGNNISTIGIPYGQVDTSSTATAFTATVPGIDRLEDGVCVLLRNGKVTSTTGFTIDINGLGAKPAYSSMGTGSSPSRVTTLFNINYTILFVYSTTLVDGGCWIYYYGYNSNTDTVGYELRTNKTLRTVTDTARYYKLYFSSADDTQWIPASVNSSNNISTARTPNQRPINPFGTIVYTTSNSSIASGSDLPATVIWRQDSFNPGFSFGPLATNLTVKLPTYLKCAPQPDGSAIIDVDAPIVQQLPSTEDGKIYIYLGIGIASTATTYNNTYIELDIYHPVYYYKNGGIRVWTNDVPVDQVLDSGSTNPISNAAVSNAFNNLSFDDLNDKPTKLSDFANDCNFATSGASLVRAYAGHVDDYLTHADASGESPDTDITQGTGDEALCFIYQVSNGNYTLVALSIAEYLDETFNVKYRVSTGNSISLAEMEIVECGTVTNPDFTLIVGDYDIGEYRCFFTCGANAMSITFNGVTIKWKEIPQLVLGDRYEISILRCSTNYYGVMIRYE